MSVLILDWLDYVQSSIVFPPEILRILISVAALRLERQLYSTMAVLSRLRETP
jgi:hypothetical protein